MLTKLSNVLLFFVEKREKIFQQKLTVCGICNINVLNFNFEQPAPGDLLGVSNTTENMMQKKVIIYPTKIPRGAPGSIGTSQYISLTPLDEAIDKKATVPANYNG